MDQDDYESAHCARIAQAVNSHAALVEALRGLLDARDAKIGAALQTGLKGAAKANHDAKVNSDYRVALDKARAALAAAEEA